LVQIDRAPCWSATYREGEAVVTIDGTSTAECPVSYITGKSFELVSAFHRANLAGGKVGTMYGPDISQWPAWAVDAWSVMEMERRRVESTLMHAMRQNNAERS